MLAYTDTTSPTQTGFRKFIAENVAMAVGVG
jgi:hypothetical protein